MFHGDRRGQEGTGTGTGTRVLRVAQQKQLTIMSCHKKAIMYCNERCSPGVYCCLCDSYRFDLCVLRSCEYKEKKYQYMYEVYTTIYLVRYIHVQSI